MKYLISGLYLVIITLTVACGSEGSNDGESEKESHDHGTSAQPASTAKSPRTAAMANLGENHIHIDYSSPSVRGRVIWGGLVPYDEVWVTGAHKATSISFTKPVVINGTTVAEGKYALFTIPGKSSWTVILNENWDQHLADDYDPAKDLVRVNASLNQREEIQESLKFEVMPLNERTAEVRMSWEKLSISFEVVNADQ